MKVETPGSNGAFGPSSEVAAMTFPRAPILNELGIARSSTQPSTVTVHYKLSEVHSGDVHDSQFLISQRYTCHRYTPFVLLILEYVR